MTVCYFHSMRRAFINLFSCWHPRTDQGACPHIFSFLDNFYLVLPAFRNRVRRQPGDSHERRHCVWEPKTVLSLPMQKRELDLEPSIEATLLQIHNSQDIYASTHFLRPMYASNCTKRTIVWSNALRSSLKFLVFEGQASARAMPELHLVNLDFATSYADDFFGRSSNGFPNHPGSKVKDSCMMFLQTYANS